MPCDFILGTAGHIDHGKTALVKALTGTNCDRLPEEKRRGITIDIGFATLDLGAYRLGIVDVPGHERFIKNMLAGATGVDLALLVVAADDSVMPQTREHLEILRLLGLRHGVIALTKCDLVDEDTRGVAALEIRELVQGTFLEHAALVETSAQAGTGLDTLREALATACQAAAADAGLQQAAGWFRLAIDRSFIVQGHGTVVTGSVTGGSLAVGAEVEWLPRCERVRVRSLQNHGKPVEVVRRGMRAAINLAGVHQENVVRGQELATPGYLFPTRCLTVRLHCLAGAGRPLRHRGAVRVHLGAAELMGSLALLDADRIEPGGWGLAQIFLKNVATATWGQPLVVRSPSAAQTLGGGQVLQPVTRKLRRQQPDTLARLTRLWNGTAAERALEVAWFAGFAGVTAADLVRGAGVTPAEATPLLDQLRGAGQVVQVGHQQPLIHADLVHELEERLLKVLARLHQQTPLAPGHDRQKVLSEFAYVGNEELAALALERLCRQGRVVAEGAWVRRRDFQLKLSNALTRLKEKVVTAYAAAGLRPPRADSFAGQAGGHAGNLTGLLAQCVQEGSLVYLDEDYYLHRTTADQMCRLLADKMGDGSGRTVAEIRDLLGTSRKHALLVCTYLDRIGVTRRAGDRRVWTRATPGAAGPPPADPPQ